MLELCCRPLTVRLFERSPRPACPQKICARAFLLSGLRPNSFDRFFSSGQPVFTHEEAGVTLGTFVFKRQERWRSHVLRVFASRKNKQTRRTLDDWNE